MSDLLRCVGDLLIVPRNATVTASRCWICAGREHVEVRPRRFRSHSFAEPTHVDFVSCAPCEDRMRTVRTTSATLALGSAFVLPIGLGFAAREMLGSEWVIVGAFAGILGAFAVLCATEVLWVSRRNVVCLVVLEHQVTFKVPYPDLTREALSEPSP